MSFIMINQNFKNIIKITYFGVFNFSFRKKKEKKKHFFFFLKKKKIKKMRNIGNERNKK